MSQNSIQSDPTVTALAPVLEGVKAFAKQLVIKSPAAYELAAQHLKQIKGAIATIEDARTRITKPINEGLRQVNAQAKEASAPLLEQERLIKGAMIRFSDEQDRLRDEEQRRSNERAEAERRRLLEAAERNAAKGNDQKANSFEERAAAVVAPVAQQAAPKVSGTSISEVWDFEITDEDLIPRAYCEVSSRRIRAQVAATKGHTQIPGVRVFKTKRIAAGVA